MYIGIYTVKSIEIQNGLKNIKLAELPQKSASPIFMGHGRPSHPLCSSLKTFHLGSSEGLPSRQNIVLGNFTVQGSWVEPMLATSETRKVIGLFAKNVISSWTPALCFSGTRTEEAHPHTMLCLLRHCGVLAAATIRGIDKVFEPGWCSTCILG